MSLQAAQALKLVLENAAPLGAERIALNAKALGRVLSTALRAPQPSPRWDVSAMDGFAVNCSDFPRAYFDELEITGTAKAGDGPLKLQAGAAIRIMTGALIPAGADAVVSKELTRVENGQLFVDAAADVQAGDHIRVAGEELKRGAEVAKAGTRLSSRWIGFLNGLGIAEAAAYRQPKVALLVSGSELKSAGSSLKPGQIHDSNGPMLESALAECGLKAKPLRLADHPQKIKSALSAALKSSDLLLLSGGVSVGDADYSKAALKELGVSEIFWGVAQKPGKPLFFGRRGKTLVFGLPGNPSAAWVCFHEYVMPAIEAMQGLKAAAPARFAMADSTPRRDPRKTLFLKARLDGPKVSLLSGQQSHMLKSLAEANALALVSPQGKGRLLEVRPL